MFFKNKTNTLPKKNHIKSGIEIIM